MTESKDDNAPLGEMLVRLGDIRTALFNVIGRELPPCDIVQLLAGMLGRYVGVNSSCLDDAERIFALMFKIMLGEAMTAEPTIDWDHFGVFDDRRPPVRTIN